MDASYIVCSYHGPTERISRTYLARHTSGRYPYNPGALFRTGTGGVRKIQHQYPFGAEDMPVLLPASLTLQSPAL